MKKKLFVLMLSGLLAFTNIISSFAGSWLQDGTGWWYQNDDGSYPVNGWYWLDGNGDGVAECYYFNAAGYCLINTVTPDGYMVDENGAWIVNGVIQTQKIVPVQSTDQKTSVKQNAEGISSTPYEGFTIVVNTNTHKYHVPSCSSVSDIKEKNKGYSSDSSYLLANGYAACKRCH